MNILGIDPSINGTGFTLLMCNDDDTLSYKDIFHIGFTKVKKKEYHNGKLHILLLDKFYGDYPYHYRGKLILEHAMNYFNINIVDYVAIEDYSYGSSGNVFDIAEMVGSIKNQIYELGIPYKKYPPSSVKGFATNKGNCDKVPMGMAYNGLKNTLESKKFILDEMNDLDDFVSPKADIVDSFWMAQLLRYELCYLRTKQFPLDVSTNLDAIVGGKKKTKTLPTLEHPIIRLHSVN